MEEEAAKSQQEIDRLREVDPTCEEAMAQIESSQRQAHATVQVQEQCEQTLDQSNMKAGGDYRQV